MLDWKRTIQILVIILALGSAFRFYHLDANSFVADEFLDINSSYGRHQTGEWRAWDFNYGVPSTMNENAARDERAAPYKLQVAAIFSVLPPTEAVARSVSVVWGIFAILIVFWSAWIFTTRRDISLVAALLCALSISAIIFSRRLRMYAMFFPLYLTAATAFYAAYEKAYQGKITALRQFSGRFGIHLPYLVLGIIVLPLSLSVHQMTAHLPLAIGAYLMTRTIFAYRETGRFRNKYGISVAIGLVGAVLAVVAVPKAIGAFTQELVFFDDHFGYIGHVLNDFSTPLIGTLLLILGFWTLFRTAASRSAALYLAAAYLVPLLMAIFLWRRNVGPQYIFFIQSFGMILAAAGIVGVFEFLRRSMGGRWNIRLALLSGLGLFLLVPNLGYFLEENNTYHETSTGGNPNYRKVFAYFKKERIDGDILITRNFRNYYWGGAKATVYDFGGELSKDKLSFAEVKKIEADHSSGWFIYSGNDEDYISSEVEQYVAKNWERVSNANV
ncbi:MAG: hypothetical protein WAT81_04455, partial [Candidatus Moraniibacteriota bacterium]